MTSLTGSTDMVLPSSYSVPPKAAIFGGCAIELATLAFVWTQHSPLAACLADPSTCWADPWSRVLLSHLVVVALVWLYSLRTIPTTGTSDPSIVDRLWSNLPYIYSCALAYGWPSLRLLVMAACATAWGLRLSYNFVLKGGFSGGEDYRWVEVRKWFVGAPWYLSFESFNLFFIVIFQLLVVLAFTSPAALAAYSARPFGALDFVALAAFCAFFTIEAVADAQMFAYQTEKYRRRAAGQPAGEYARGFIETGLWAYSRHPKCAPFGVASILPLRSSLPSFLSAHPSPEPLPTRPTPTTLRLPWAPSCPTRPHATHGTRALAPHTPHTPSRHTGHTRPRACLPPGCSASPPQRLWPPCASPTHLNPTSPHPPRVCPHAGAQLLWGAWHVVGLLPFWSLRQWPLAQLVCC